ncbi:MAG: FeoA domain-containing protein [Acidobacteria bacterium]|nr:FeoA domain-containing protein [Acidobacteriota bacterium]
MVDPATALLIFCGLCIVLAGLLWPSGGLVPRWLRMSQLGERVRLEDALKHVLTCRQTGQGCSVDSVAGRLGLSPARATALLSSLVRMGLIRMEPDGPALTREGSRSAVGLVRTHRLWERYLADRTGVPPAEWHEQAERMEHTLSAEQTDALEVRLGHPNWDPHGDPIPDASGEPPPAPGVSLAEVDPGRTVEIVHLEDEPRETYDALLDDGLVLGGRLEVLGRDAGGIRVRAAGREWTLDLVASRNVSVRRLAAGERAEPASMTLEAARIGEPVRVVEISRACQGPERRRLLDLGLVRGTEITARFASAAGDPVAYTIRGALIALRRRQASWIAVEPTTDRPLEVS